MKSNEQQQKDFKFTINMLNSRGRWLISNKELASELRALSSFDNMTTIPQYITNAMQYYVREGLAIKHHNPGVYFAFIKHKYFSIDDPAEALNRIKKQVKISKKTILSFNTLDTLDTKVTNDIHNKESLFSTIIEKSTLSEENIEFRDKNKADPEIIEKDNIISAYSTLMSNKAKPMDDFKLKEIHSLLFRGLTGSNRINGIDSIGKYCQHQNFISGGYLPCLLEEKLSQLKKWIEFYNEKPSDIEDAIYRVSILHYWFAGIHIFQDGNSRTGRFLLSYYMKLHKLNKRGNFAISRAMNGLGGKNIFVEAQGKAWDSKDVTEYSKWFINWLLDMSWVQSMEKYI